MAGYPAVSADFRRQDGAMDSQAPGLAEGIQTMQEVLTYLW